jgi:hypothetical protein
VRVWRIASDAAVLTARRTASWEPLDTARRSGGFTSATLSLAALERFVTPIPT